MQSSDGLLLAGLCCLGPVCLAAAAGIVVRVLRGVFRVFAGE